MNIQAKNRFTSSREIYGDGVTGYVCLKRQNAKCTIRVRICPEHRVEQKDYTFIIKIDEKNDKIRSLECLDCV